ncbi:SRPBCC family protein [Georgenia faecalis]|uniref:SRPBCC domain-containing protein n=1 Tax=Georgenia faecalis TaxID=2483799 RepID=A0ABV9D7U6_9MICO|nr:SRPBCC domain-containing protein [Georgenia faecalis]
MAGTFDVEVSRDFAAPVERVWAAWTEPADLRRWWGPAGFTCPRAEADVRVGGRIAVTMRAPEEWGGFEQHSTWTITDLDAPRHLRYVFTFTDAAGTAITPEQAGIPAEGVPERGEHEVRLEDLGEGRTRLHMREAGYGTSESRDMSRAGLEQCLDKMAALVGRPDDGARDPGGHE